MARRGWDGEPQDNYAELRETLAWTILFRLNPYPDALRLASGGPTPIGNFHDDEDFWLQCVRGSQIGGVKWPHTTINSSSPDCFVITRAARIPYLAKNKSGRYFLDHLLVGYSQDNAVTSPLVHSWGGPATQGGSAQPRYPNLAQLGTFLVEDLWPGSVGGAIQRVEGWNNPYHATTNPYGYKESVLYGGTVQGCTPPVTGWEFREMRIKPEKSVVIFVVGEKAGVYTQWALVVGYEGGGAW